MKGSEQPVLGERLMSAFARGGTIVSLIGLIVLFSVLRPEIFPTDSTLTSALSQAAVLAMIAGGLTIVLVLADFDLSIGLVSSLTGVIVASLLGGGMGIAMAILIGLGVGLAIGIFNGLMVAYGQLNSFIATLGSGAVLQGVILWVTNGGESQPVPESANAFIEIGQGKVLGIPTPAIISAVGIVLLWLLLNKTVAGRRIDATGGNQEAARLSGIPVKRYRLMGFAIGGLFAGAAGILLAAEQGSGYAESGTPLLLSAYTACFLGAVTLRENEFHIVGTVVGIAILTVTFIGLSVLAVPVYWQNIAQGGILIISVSVTVLVSRLQPVIEAKRVVRQERSKPPAAATKTGV